jgi:hypothetical protein
VANALAFEFTRKPGGSAVLEARDENRQRWMSRRAFLRSGAAAGAATVALGGMAPQGAGAAPTNDVDAMVLQIAAAAAVFPMRFDTRESEPASARLTAARVAQARARGSAARLAQADRGAQLLIDRKLGGASTNALLGQLSVVADESSPDDLADLKALVAMAGATLADRVDPKEELRPGMWLRGLAIMHERGETPVVGG